MRDLISRREAAGVMGAAAAGFAALLADSSAARPAEPAAAPVKTSPNVRTQRVQVGGAQLSVRRAGSGFPILLLHGWPEFSLTWEPVMDLLAGQFELIAPDLRGFGDSDKPNAPFGAKEQAADLVGLMNSLKLDKFGVVSHDVGGAVAQALAAAAPDRVAGLMFFSFIHPGVGARFFAPDRLNLVWYMFFHEMDFAAQMVGASRENIDRYFGHFLREWPYRKGAFDDVMPAFIDNFAKPGNIQGGFDYYRAAIPPRTNPPGGRLPPPPPPIHIRTAVRWPEHDLLFPPAWTDTLPKFFTNLDLKPFPGVGHFPHREDPMATAGFIREFFKT